MKVLLFNGSPRGEMCTYTALSEIAGSLQSEGVETEIFWVGNKPVTGCIGCGACENICPARPVKAIRVNGVAKQHFVEKPVATKSAVLDSEEDFPF